MVNKRWPSVAAQLDTPLETRPQQHTTMRREHPNRTDRHNPCMRMQTTAHTLLCTAKHDCTMNALRTGQSRDEGEAAGLAEDTFTIGPVLSKTCQALGPNQVAVVEQARHKNNMFFTSIQSTPTSYGCTYRTVTCDLAELCTKNLKS